jgi:hypothetical protein
LIERQNNNIEQAAALAQTVVTLKPGNADGQFLLGQVLDKLGRPTRPSNTGSVPFKPIRTNRKRFIASREL